MRTTFTKINSFYLVSLMAILILISCSKNQTTAPTQLLQGQPVVELIVAPGSTTPKNFRVVSYDASINSAVNTVYVNYASSSPAPRDIVVTLVVSPSTISDYNTKNSTNFIFVDPAVYSFNTKVIIKKGTYATAVPITFNPAMVNARVSSAFAVEIADAQGITISNNVHTQMYALLLTNPYEGMYTSTGWFFHPTAGRQINAQIPVTSINGVRSETFLGDLGEVAGYYFDFDVINTLVTNWGAAGYTPGATGLGCSGFMTLDNPGGIDYSNSTNGGNVPGVGQWVSSVYNNTYDRINKTFYLHYGYYNNSPGSQSIYNRQLYVKMVKN